MCPTVATSCLCGGGVQVTDIGAGDTVRTSPGSGEGVYVRGLMLEGAAWSKTEKTLVECVPKELYSPFPVVLVTAVSNMTARNKVRHSCGAADGTTASAHATRPWACECRLPRSARTPRRATSIRAEPAATTSFQSTCRRLTTVPSTGSCAARRCCATRMLKGSRMSYTFQYLNRSINAWFVSPRGACCGCARLPQSPAHTKPQVPVSTAVAPTWYRPALQPAPRQET